MSETNKPPVLKAAQVTPTPNPTKATISDGTIAGISVGSVSCVILMVSVLILVLRLRLKRDRRRFLGYQTDIIYTPLKLPRPTVNKKPTFHANYNAQLNRLTSRELNTWVGFLSIYGEQGVPLRELIMLVSVLYFPIAELGVINFGSSLGHECKLANAPDFNTLFLSLLKEASCKEELTKLEQKLVSLGVVFIRDAGEQDSVGPDQDWVTDNRLWCSGRRQFEAEIDAVEVCKNLMVLYSRFPDRDNHLLAESHRESCYYHAHAAIVYIYRWIREEILALDKWKEQFCDVTLNVLSHRYQPEDEQILDYIYYLLTNGVSSTDLTVSSTMHRARDHGQMNRLLLYHLIKLKTNASPDLFERARPRDNFLINKSLEVIHEVLDRPYLWGLRTWGTAGYTLAELIATSEAAHDIDGVEQAVKLGKEWVEKCLMSHFQNLAALCCMLVKIQAFDELHKLPTERHLACGYYLARAGFLQLAECFLVSGLQYNEQEMADVPMWRYHLELWTIRLRLGQWEDAEQWLLSTWHGLSTRTNDLPPGEFDYWRLSGEFGEFKLNLASLLSDCYVAKGLYGQASNLLETTIRSNSRMRDTYISAARVTLLSRLLNVQLYIEKPHHAAVTALQLCHELQDSKFLFFGSPDISWTVQEILACVNQLVKAGISKKAYVILLALKELDVYRFGHVHDDDLTNPEPLNVDLLAYIEQIWNEVGSMLSAENPLRSQRPLSKSLNDLTMQPLLFGITHGGNHSPVLGLPEKTSKPGSKVKCNPYVFPAPRRNINIAPSQEFENPVAEGPKDLRNQENQEDNSFGSQVPQAQDSVATSATHDEQEAVSEARRSRIYHHKEISKGGKAANRKGQLLRNLMNLRKPPNDFSTQLSTIEEGRSRSEKVGEGFSSSPMMTPLAEMPEFPAAVELADPDSTQRWELSGP